MPVSGELISGILHGLWSYRLLDGEERKKWAGSSDYALAYAKGHARHPNLVQKPVGPEGVPLTEVWAKSKAQFDALLLKEMTTHPPMWPVLASSSVSSSSASLVSL